MSKGVSSRHLGGASELLLMVPIRTGLAGGISYATRLRILLETLFALRKNEAETKAEDGAGPLDRLRSIYTTQWAVLDDPVAPRLVVSACFDRSWEDYVRILVDKTGPLLDLLFIHCKGYEEAHTCVGHGHEAFSQWLRSHQIPVSLFHTGLPNVTVDDVRIYRKLATRPPNVSPASVTIGSPKEEEEERVLQRPNQIEEARKVEEQQRGLLEKLAPLATLFGSDAGGFFERAASSLIREDAMPAHPASDAVIEAPIQGNILRPYERMDYGRAVLISCNGERGLRGMLGDLRERITLEEGTTTEQTTTRRVRLNVALTAGGLARAGMAEEQLAWFPREFTEGMSNRAALVGDVGFPNHPEHWPALLRNWPAPKDERVDLADVDAVVVLQGDFSTLEEADDALDAECEAIESAGGSILHVQALQRTFEDKAERKYREHFGFLDSGEPGTGSQPVPKVSIGAKGRDLSAAAHVAKGDVVPLGELFLGYRDSTGRVAPCADETKNPRSFRFFKDGTFLVMRKLEQNVEAFENFVSRNVAGAKLNDGEIRARILGRAVDGTPLVPANDPRKLNDFDYEKDEAGLRCPLHAHIRRANPRTEATPRILRRSFAYGSRYVKPADGSAQVLAEESARSARGILFMAYNANIAAQFEVIQRWLNGGSSTGLPSVQNDLLTAPPRGGAHAFLLETGGRGGPNAFQVKNGNDGKDRTEVEPVVLDQTGAERPFVALRWGLYLFVPSLTAIDELVGVGEPLMLRNEQEPVTAEDELDHLIDDLRLPQEGPDAHLRWKELLEDAPEKAAQLWKAIRATKTRTLKTPYGFLVATAADAQRVLSDEASFSVREYWQRLRETIGEHYLALDREPTPMRKREVESTFDDTLYELRVPKGLYGRLAAAPNSYIWNELSSNARAFTGTATPSNPFDLARRLTRSSIMEFAQLSPPESERVGLDLQALVAMSIGRLAQLWIGLPLPDPCSGFDVARLMDSFVQVSLCSFQPHPDAELREKARLAGRSLVDAYSAAPELLRTTMAEDVRKAYAFESGKASEELVQLALIGAIVGFAPPAIKATITALVQLLGSGRLPKLARATPQVIIKAVLDQLLGAPVPAVLYRTAMPGAKLAGELIEPGSFVVVGLHSAWVSALEQGDTNDAWKWMFGGDHQGKADGTTKTAHGCPARFAAADAMAGIIAEISELDGLEREGPIALSFKR